MYKEMHPKTKKALKGVHINQTHLQGPNVCSLRHPQTPANCEQFLRPHRTHHRLGNL